MNKNETKAIKQEDDLDKFVKQIKKIPPLIRTAKQLVVNYVCDNKQKIETVYVNLQDDDHIKVNFAKGHIIVSTDTSVVFMCKIKDFISLWH